jgi:hypothetical protein
VTLVLLGLWCSPNLEDTVVVVPGSIPGLAILFSSYKHDYIETIRGICRELLYCVIVWSHLSTCPPSHTRKFSSLERTHQ